MNNEVQLINKTEKMIDEIKSVCATYGLSGASSEYKIITEIFLYKYLNDKFLCELRKVSDNLNKDATMKEVEKYLNDISAEEYSLLIMQKSPNVAKIRKEYLISYLFNNQNSSTPQFYELFDSALEGISNDNIGIFSVKTGSKDTIKLFEPLSQYIPESNKKNLFFRAIISKLVEFSFAEAFEEKYDFFSTVFEYLIKDYNKDFGKYAEYYTPNSIARIIARIMVPDKVQNVTVYDPAAGSGTLILALAHQIGEDNCTIYTQDISQKSSELLRLNLILNNLVHSLGNVIHGDTLLNPAHLNEQKNGLKKFDYIVSNPPFKMDFSETRDKLTDDKFKDRFFAGVPNIPINKKDSMGIYLMFIQHIIYSLSESGKAAIVVPTGFISSKTGIELKIKKKLVSEKSISAVINMPSNIFATTGTNVSVIFIDKSQKNNEVYMCDVSNYGHSVKEGHTKKTILYQNEIDEIVNSVLNRTIKDRVSVIVNTNDIVNNNYVLTAGQYFKVKIEYSNQTSQEFENRIKYYKQNLDNLFSENDKYENEIIKNLESLSYEEHEEN
jgi:type I restriction enzyme M protein